MDKTSICNLALGHLGSKRIENITESTAEAEVCNEFFDHARDSMLRLRDWNFARGRQKLPEVTAPAFGFGKAFGLPADFVAARAVNGKEAGTPGATFEIVGREIHTDLDSVELKYTRREGNTQIWDPVFVDVFSYELAALIAPSLLQEPQVAATMRQLGDALLKSRAAPADVQESQPKAIRANANTARSIRSRTGYPDSYPS